MKGPAIEFLHYEIERIEYSREITNEDREGSSLKDMGITCGISENLEYGKVTIQNTIIDSDNERKIFVSISGHYKINDGFNSNEDEAKSYIVTNGTAILYPYVRSVFSIISTLDSNDAIVLPTVNVNELFNS